MRNLFLTVIFVPYLLVAQVSYSFSNLGLNYYDWRQESQNVGLSKNFSFISAEYGIGSNWAEFYGNTNIENPLSSYSNKVPNNLRFTMVNDFDIKLTESFRIHVQDFHLQTDTYFVNDFVLGFSYKYMYEGLWFKPFLGVHYTYDTFYSGLNGLMTGWLFNYRFKILSENFSIFQWSEIEFLRDQNFYELKDGTPIGDSKSYGYNGSIKLYWHPIQSVTTGLEYRYSQYKRGTKEYLSALIYSIKYNF